MSSKPTETDLIAAESGSTSHESPSSARAGQQTQEAQTSGSKLGVENSVHKELAFKSFVEALVAHQKLIVDSALQQQRAVDALKDLDAANLSAFCRHSLWGSSTAATFNSRWPPAEEQHVTFLSPASGNGSQQAQAQVQHIATAELKNPEESSQPSGETVILDLDQPMEKEPEVLPSEHSGDSQAYSLASDGKEMSSSANKRTAGRTQHKPSLMLGKSAALDNGTDENGNAYTKLWSIKPVPMDLGGFTCTKPIRKVIASQPFEMMCTGVLLANVFAMVVRLELEGLLAGEELGEISPVGISQGTLDAMNAMEIFFTMWFTVELLLRYWALGCHVFHDSIGLFDAIVVFATLVDFVMNEVFGLVEGTNLTSARMLRLLKVLKFFRTFKAASAFTELRILLRTVLRSTMALMWTMVVLTMIILASSNLVAQLLQGYISDVSNPHDLRVWVFQMYGTASRAAYTMLEATLSGAWPTYARRLVVEVNPLWSIFWIFYVFAIIFAVIRVMGALFLAASLKAASEDDDMQALRRVRDSKAWKRKLRRVFFPNYESGGSSSRLGLLNGGAAGRKKKPTMPMPHISRGHLLSVLAHDSCRSKLEIYGFEPVEFRMLFDLLADEEEKVDTNAFFHAALRLKGGVKAIDVIEILQEVEIIKQLLENHGSPRMGEAISLRNQRRYSFRNPDGGASEESDASQTAS
mmetsp:Transcript_19625/g.45690  ORF Transcript_19625/g.45690 Transcript_19625/m.45690 type:complete len:695 (+) Transcript_19625:176-2260(+)